MRRGRRKVGTREKVFGCDLLDHLSSTSQDIPQVLRSCSDFIEKHGIVDGIYRLSGVSSNTQRLRSEFDSEGSPDLCKDIYLQDIHCVSSLCKAYFRELPNPLLTYELYDRFADAVAIQLEDERLVKIRDVLKDLPAPHYRTLEYLMRHLVKMSKSASQTNMHSRNLAIVWAPNLLRSKDIESTGFNGTAAFMEVRVQSIVVEFILTHVPELFPETGLSIERRKSLPSPSILSSQDDHFFKSLPLHCSGNLSPGDGPPPMRPYHAIIEGTDKRKGSLKGRKWKSIFNLGGRLHDPRKKNKYCPKDKETTSLRPAKSMDSLSSGAYAVEDSKHPPAALPPLVLSAGSSEGVASTGGGVSSGYAVTYRRTGGAQVSVVSAGTPGSYTRLESGGGAEGPAQGVSKSPAMSSKAERRAGIHISGPFSVTVPLHITSGLALGVLHGGWNDKEQTQGEDEDVKSTDGDSESKNNDVQESQTEINSSEGELGKETPKEDQNQETVDDSKPKDEMETPEEDYMDMRARVHQEPVSPLYYEDGECPDQDLQLDLAFGFLDSVESCASNQPEFSVEAPCFDGEYEEEEDEDQGVLNCTDVCEKPAPETNSSSFTHRPLPGKSHSLPYKSRPFLPALSLSSDDDYSPADDDDGDEDESDKGSEYEDMFCQSLPSTRDFQGLSWACPPSNQSECLEDTQITVAIPPASSLTDAQKQDALITEDKKNEDLTQVESEKHTLIREDNAESEASEEDTYFGPDSIPSSPEPNQIETNGINTDENPPSDEQTQIRSQRQTENEENPEDEESMNTAFTDEEQKTEIKEDSQEDWTRTREREKDLEEGDGSGEDCRQEQENKTESGDLEQKDEDQKQENKTQIGDLELNDENEDQKPEKMTQIRNVELNNDEIEDRNLEKMTEGEDVELNDENEDQKLEKMTQIGDLELNDENEDQKPEKMTQIGYLELNDKNEDQKQEMTTQIGDLEINDGQNEDQKQEMTTQIGDLELNNDENEDQKPKKMTDGEDVEQNNEEHEDQKPEKMTDGEDVEQNNDENEDQKLEKITQIGDLEQNDDENEDQKAEKMTQIGDLELNDETEDRNLEKTTEGEDVKLNDENEDQKQENKTESEDLKQINDENEDQKPEKMTEGEDVEQNHENEDQKHERISENEDLEQINQENEDQNQENKTESEDLELNNDESEDQKPEKMTDGEDVEQMNDENEDQKPEKMTENEDLERNEDQKQENKTESEDMEQKHDNQDQKPEKMTESDENEENAEDEGNLLESNGKNSSVEEIIGGTNDPERSRSMKPKQTVHSPRQTKAVPAVPPKPQNSKLTALTLRKQFEHRHPQDDEEHAEELNKLSDADEAEGLREQRGTSDSLLNWRTDVHKEAEKEAKRNSGISICFDEAVARATVKRSRERDNTDRLSGAHWDRRDGKTD